jgi:hypothetical protein
MSIKMDVIQKFASTLVNLVITETEPNLYGYYRNRTVFLYETVFTEVLKLYLPKNRINRTELTILTERAAGLSPLRGSEYFCYSASHSFCLQVESQKFLYLTLFYLQLELLLF